MSDPTNFAPTDFGKMFRIRISTADHQVYTYNRAHDNQKQLVKLNGEIVQRDAFTATTVKDGDTVEFLYFMGGGSAANED